MNYLSTDHLIVYAFLLITLAIGLWAGRGIKDIKEYALGNRQWSTLTLTLTFLATNIGGVSILDGSGRVFSDGIASIIPEFGVIITALFVSFFIAKKIIHFNGCLTLGDVMETLYGPSVKTIAGILGLLYSISMVSMELLGLGIVFKTLIGIEAHWGIIVGGLILALYSAHGGIKSVAITDVFQFAILVVIIPVVASLVLKQVGGTAELFSSLPAEKLVVFGHKDFSFYLTLFLVWSIFPVGITSPPIFQRLLMAQKAHQVRDQFFVVSGFHPAFQLLIMLIGLAGFVLYPTVHAENITPHIIQHLLPVGIKGLAIAGLLAVIMSTADSYLHSAGLLLAHDIVKPLCDRYNIKVAELTWARYGTLAIGIAAITVALRSTNMLALSFAAVRFTGPLLMFPLVAGIMGLKADQRSFYQAAGVTLVAFVAASFLLPASQSHLAVLVGIMANGITFFGTHILQNKGLATAQYTQQGPNDSASKK